jgi:hypothetical protein
MTMPMKQATVRKSKNVVNLLLDAQKARGLSSFTGKVIGAQLLCYFRPKE